MSWACQKCTSENVSAAKECNKCGAIKGEFECPPDPSTYVERPTDKGFREAFFAAKRRYEETLSIVAGTGDYGSGYIDRYYQEMVAAHALMGAADRAANKLPAKESCADDGTAGIASGLGDHFSRRAKDDGRGETFSRRDDECCIQ